MTPEVDKNVPIPPAYSGHKSGRKNIELLKKMDVGDSIFFPDMTTTQAYNKVFSSAQRLGIKLTSRSVDDGARIWRIQ